MEHLACLLYLANICPEVLLTKVLGQSSVSDRPPRLLYLIRPTYALRCFSPKCSVRGRHVLHRGRPLFWLGGTYKQPSCHSTPSSSCQCRRDIPGVASSCLTWTARDLQQWTGSDIESRRHCLTMDGFRHRESSSLLTLLQVLGYAPAQPPLGQTRGFAHYQYYYTHRRPRLMHSREHQEDHPKDCPLHFLCLQLHRWPRLEHNREQKRDHLEGLVSRCQKPTESFTSLFWLEAHSNTNYLLLVHCSEAHPNTNYLLQLRTSRRT